MLTTPAGIPARCANSAKAKAHKGVCSAGLITMVQPAAIAGAILRVIIAIGKFHGVIATHTPIACFRTSMRLSPQVLSRMAPVTRFDSSANHSTNEAPYATSPRDSTRGLPCSRVIKIAKSSVLAIIRSNHLRITMARSLAVFERQLLSACSAAVMANSASALFRFVTLAMMSPVAGLLTEKVAPDLALTHLPLIKASSRNKVASLRCERISIC